MTNKCDGCIWADQCEYYDSEESEEQDKQTEYDDYLYEAQNEYLAQLLEYSDYEMGGDTGW